MALNREDEISLREYETCQQHINAMMSHYWILFSVFMPVSTALLAIVPYVILTLNEAKWIILIFGLGIVFILIFLKIYFNRVNALISIAYFRMREIETQLGMFKNLYVHQLDHWDKNILVNEVKSRIDAPLRGKHTGHRGRTFIGFIFYVLIALWLLSILWAFIAPCIGITKISS